MKFLFSTGSLWSYSIERCFAFAAQTGFDGLEILVDQRWESRQAPFLLRLVDRYELPVEAIHSPFWPRVPGWPADQPGRIIESVKLAEAVGAEVVVHHLPSRMGYVIVMGGSRFTLLPLPGWDNDRGYRRWLEDTYPTVCADTNVRLCIENMPAYRRFGRRWNLYHWNSLQEIVRFPALTLDTTHIGTWGLDPVSVYRRLDGRVNHVHLSNFDGREHRPPETGHLPLDEFLRQLVEDEYAGAVSLEVFPEALGAGGADEVVIERMEASLRHCRQWCVSDD